MKVTVKGKTLHLCTLLVRYIFHIVRSNLYDNISFTSSSHTTCHQEKERKVFKEVNELL